MGKRSGLSRSRSSDVAGRFDAALLRAEALLPGVARTLAAVSGPTSAGVRGALAKDFSRTRTRADYLAIRAEPARRATSLARFAAIERLRCCLREVAGVDVRATAA